MGVDSRNTKKSNHDSKQRSCFPLERGPITLCARHDLQIGRYLLELEPAESHLSGTVLLYLSFVDTTDGDVCWKGCARFETGAVWEALLYGGPPLELDCHTDEVQSH